MRSIDFHAHLTPQCFWRATENGGDWHGIRREQDARGRQIVVSGTSRGQLPPKASWTPEQRLADMESLGVDIHVVSPFSGFYNYELDAGLAMASSRETNDEISQMMMSWPDRFHGLATLPMQDVPAAVQELERVMVELEFKGAVIDDKVNGKLLDDPEFMPFWKAAEQLGAVILFHQGGETIVDRRIKRYHLPNSVGNLADRTLTFASLVMGGVMDACPDLRICLSHGGGYACYGAGRMDRGWDRIPQADRLAAHPPSQYLNRFYYDCIVYTEQALRFLIDSVGIERVVFGTDWPYDMAQDWPVSWILSLDSITQEEKDAILWKNLENLLGV
ncbi:MAG: amidohydrolase [Chloroflexi bacterium]|nr:amidohydrolase [Chloroflexota bacterium]MYD49807.1 amidohydrolase [Chloroflexota bacterium]